MQALQERFNKTCDKERYRDHAHKKEKQGNTERTKQRFTPSERFSNRAIYVIEENRERIHEPVRPLKKREIAL